MILALDYKEQLFSSGELRTAHVRLKATEQMYR
jgi:hypothetical protein